ncbi:hypothetical protein [Halalkalibacter akibai]|uniref:DUF4830 domain-containing protein n=1 Tax=Halalkalibacter akibai (strain ATCC 43226 / DSM 21942 / CIP 109018 / JCM 9157 / 1139) TaxID=1236973 RepID=W4QWF3_HALA3|nr:hypothetical protein [Halalkalibacter akibai]GAE35973.1 hypothetical protein JCM9157_3117 [Halalkalibacter akibai JCM 9157]
MRKLVSFLVIAVLFAFLLVGCSDNQNIDNQSKNYSSNNAKKAAWNFIIDQGWDDTAKGNWRDATLLKVIVDDNYKLLDKTYKGKETLSVSFEDKENVVVGTPLILIDTKTNKVIGYRPSE